MPNNKIAKDGLDDAIKEVFPAYPAKLRNFVKNKIINFVSNGLSDGYDVALIKKIGNKTELRVLQIREENEED